MLYDEIGVGYARYRQPDPRVRALIDGALGGAERVVDIGSGTGSYGPSQQATIAVEPSLVMIEQRPAGTPPVVQAVAEHLPFPDHSFDAALAVFTTHHWRDFPAGLREMARVADAQVVLTWDPAVTARFWLVADYLPEVVANEVHLPTFAAVVDGLDVVDVHVVPVPADCVDGFFGAYWRRPEMYLDPGARDAISAFSHCDPTTVARAVERLAADIEAGRWAERHADLLPLDALDVGYRLITAHGLPNSRK